MTESNHDFQQTNTNESMQHDYHQLQIAYFQLEDDKQRLEKRLRSLRRQRRWLIMLILMMGMGMGGYFWWDELKVYLPEHELLTNQLPLIKDEPTEPKTVTGETLVVKTQLLQDKLSLIGKIEPLDQMEVISPLKGPIQEKHFEYGEFVKKGQLLLVLDTTQEKVNYREVSTLYIEALQQFKKLQNWQTEPEVTVARRELLKAQYALASTQRELAETRRLLDKGIVPASELDKLEQQYQNEKLDYQTRKEQLQQILEQGSTEYLHIAELKMKNAQFRKQEIEQRIKNARVMSPIDGVVLEPVQRDEDLTTEIQRGSFVKQDQVLFMIANMAGFLIKAKVDEVEIPKLKIHQKVTITGDAFENITLEGAIRWISSQAEKSQSSYGNENASLFPVAITVKKLTTEQKQHLRLGMSTKMSVILSEKPEAILIPFNAVTSQDEKTWVIKINQKTGQPEKMEVKTGLTTVDSIEILEGLKAGDKLVLEESDK
jgi:HlyD family secretion protein